MAVFPTVQGALEGRRPAEIKRKVEMVCLSFRTISWQGADKLGMVAYLFESRLRLWSNANSKLLAGTCTSADARLAECRTM